MTWRAPLRAKCLFCHEAKEEPKPAKVFREPKSKYCILCYVEEGVSICRKCLVPWQAAYDSNNAFSQVLKYARAEDEPHMLCLYCVAEDFANEDELTLPANALDDTARLQLTKICKVVAKFGPPPIEIIAAVRPSWRGTQLARAHEGHRPTRCSSLYCRAPASLDCDNCSRKFCHRHVIQDGGVRRCWPCLLEADAGRAVY